jgi:signal transduction histidine kinase
MQMFRHICILVATWAYVSAQCYAQTTPPGTSNFGGQILAEASTKMDKTQYDSAYQFLSSAYIQNAHRLSALDRYYLHALLSEILYYNALFEQGLAESNQSKLLAIELQNDTLLANSENMLGLLYLNLDNFDQALSNFRSGLSRFPSAHDNQFLAFRYHLLANLGECFVKMNAPDSAIYYSLWSRDEAIKLNRNRGVAFADLNVAQAAAMKGDMVLAKASLKNGLDQVINSNHRDVVLFIMAEEVGFAAAEGNSKGMNYWANLGWMELASPYSTDNARLHFLKMVGENYIKHGDVVQGQKYLNEEMMLVRRMHLQLEKNQAAIFKDFVHKSESLFLSQQMEIALENKIFWRRITIGILVILLIMTALAAVLYMAYAKRKQMLDKVESEILLQSELKRAEMEGQQLKVAAIELERNRIAADLHDDLGASLAGINIYSALAMKPGLDEESRTKWIEKIKSLSSQMIENMSDIVWSIYSINDNLPSVILRMQAYSSEVLGLQNIRVIFVADANLNDMPAKLELRHHLMMVFKESILNISKYSEATEVQIRLTSQENKLMMIIADNGIGINLDSTKTGNGLGNMQKRMSKLNGSLTINDQTVHGTELIFEIPLTLL